MLTEVSALQAPVINPPQKATQTRTSESRPTESAKTDTISLSGPTSRKDVAALVLNKTLASIQETGGLESTQNLYNGFSQKDLQNLESLVESAKADLGISPDTSFDVTPEATANRIVNFALLAFSQFQENHTELSEEDVRSEFVEFIGKAIGKGIEEARDILTGLNSLTEEVDADITTTVDVINHRLQEFADQGKTEEPASPQTNDKETTPASLN